MGTRLAPLIIQLVAKRLKWVSHEVLESLKVFGPVRKLASCSQTTNLDALVYLHGFLVLCLFGSKVRVCWSVT